MITDIALETILPLLDQYRASFIIAGVLLSLLLTWRLFRFTIQPLLYPEDPKELPYWIPVLGHALGFFNDSEKLLRNARIYFNSSREPYAVVALGMTHYVVTNPHDVSEAYRNTTTLSFHIFVQELMRSMGISDGCLHSMFDVAARHEDSKTGSSQTGLFPNPKALPLGLLSRDMHIHQLYPGDNLSILMDRLVEVFDADLQASQISRFSIDCQESRAAGITSKDTAPTLPLFDWISHVFIAAGQEVYFGSKLAQINPRMVDDFLEFDENGWQVLYQYPRFLSMTMHSSRDRLVAAFNDYFSLSQDQRSDAAWFTIAEEQEMRNLGIENVDIARMMLIIYWGINTNTAKACFWFLNYLLQQPSLLSTIRSETAPAILPNGSLNNTYLVDCCPLTSSAFDETLRMAAFSASVRFLTQDTVLGNKLLRKGNRIMIPYRQLHFDETVFGPRVYEYDANRFLNQEKRLKSPSWRPFGGGTTQCPGRYIAKQEIIAFVALLLDRYNLELVPGQNPAMQDTQRPVLGMMNKKEGSPDLLVRIEKRAKE